MLSWTSGFLSLSLFFSAWLRWVFSVQYSSSPPTTHDARPLYVPPIVASVYCANGDKDAHFPLCSLSIHPPSAHRSSHLVSVQVKAHSHHNHCALLWVMINEVALLLRWCLLVASVSPWSAVNYFLIWFICYLTWTCGQFHFFHLLGSPLLSPYVTEKDFRVSVCICPPAKFL